jgi:transposase
MNEYRTIVVADHHKTVFVCQVLDRQTGEVRATSLAARRDVLRPFLAALEGAVLVFVEACRSWEWVSDLCEELGLDLRLVDPKRMPEIARSSKKTDQHDVQAMVDRLLVQGDLPQSYRATRSERELRALTRRLGDLRETRKRLIYQIHAVIDAHGLPAKKEFFVKESWREGIRAALRELEWMDLECVLLQYDQNLALQGLLEGRIEELVRSHEDYHRLKAIPGIGPVIAATVLAESCGIQRFKSARQFASFVGLTPRVRSSAGKARMGRITRNGPPQLRWALGQAAMVSLRCKEPGPIADFYRRKRKRGKPGSVAICAAAHKLARAVWAVLTRGEDFRRNPKAA